MSMEDWCNISKNIHLLQLSLINLMNECAQYPRVMILNAGADHADGVRQKRIGCSARFRALLLEEVGTDDGHFSDLTPVHQL